MHTSVELDVKIISTADTHLGITLGRTPWSRRKSRQNIFEQFEYTANQAISKNADVFIHAGDIFNRSKPPKWAIKQYFAVIEQVLDHGIPVYVVPGNHDRAKLTSSLIEYYYPHYHVFNQLGIQTIGEVNFVGFPFVYNSPRDVFKTALSKYQRNSSLVFILCHQLFFGATFGPQQFTFRYQADVINPKLPSNIQVISGHIHRTQQLCNSQVIYTGSTVRASFAEVIEPKGFVEILVEDNYLMLQFHEIPVMSMQVREFNEIDRNQLEEIPPTQDRVLLRFVGQELTQKSLRELYSHFPKEDYPYLSISPRSGNRILNPLYANYTGEFSFPQVTRSW